jgi:hypothetical protein
MPRFSLLPRHIEESLQAIEPTQDGDLKYFPCSASLTSGEVLDTVYFMPERPVMKMWDVYLQTDGAKRVDSRGRRGRGQRQSHLSTSSLCERAISAR